MSRANLLWLCLALWVAAMAASALAWFEPPTGDGFTRGMNRTAGFARWQLAAGVLALVAWTVSHPLPPDSTLRRLSRVPAWWCLVLMAGFAGIVAITVLTSGLTSGGG